MPCFYPLCTALGNVPAARCLQTECPAFTPVSSFSSHTTLHKPYISFSCHIDSARACQAVRIAVVLTLTNSWPRPQLALNHFADVSHDEFKAHALGFRADLLKDEPKLKASPFRYENTSPPEEIDWVSKGAVTKIKNQQQVRTLCLVFWLQGRHCVDWLCITTAAVASASLVTSSDTDFCVADRSAM